MERVREGDLHKICCVGGVSFEIRYGYSTEEERERWDPTPIYPDFLQKPEFTEDGYPFATAYQDVCRWYLPRPQASGEHWCSDCMHFEKCEEYIGICKCSAKRDPDFIRGMNKSLPQNGESGAGERLSPPGADRCDAGDAL